MNSLSKVQRTLSRRPTDPRSILEDPTLAARLEQQLVGNPWDVFTTPEVADAIGGDLNPLTLNDWLYTRAPLAPPREHMERWRCNVGYYRKDVLIGWAQSGGRPVQPWQVWQLSADHLSQVLAQRHPWTLRDTEEDIQWLLARGVISLRARPKVWPFQPFTDDVLAQDPDWGSDPLWPNGYLSGSGIE